MSAHCHTSTEALLQKYNVPAPRYTSYPSVPYWEAAEPAANDWLKVVKRTFDESNTAKGISVYVHLPFCESLCTYCGCNTRITRNHRVESGYVDAVLLEWKMYLAAFTGKPVIRELHLGGGTPTFFSPYQLQRLVEGLLKDSLIHPEREFSFEGHPNNTTEAHLQVLYEQGFRRVSFGIQDFDEKVQKAIHRIQSFAQVKTVTEAARRIGYQSVNFDLIYGLPFQTVASITKTIGQVSLLQPDRIAFYSYAHVPWMKPGQRSYAEQDLPANAEKRALYEVGFSQLTQLGYHEVGMDHFALPGDALLQAVQQKRLHRNFMGYTTCQTDLLIGLGASSISDATYACVQNHKKVEDYLTLADTGKLAFTKGHFLTPDDLLVRNAILDFICRGEWKIDLTLWKKLSGEAKQEVIHMQMEELIEFTPSSIRVTDAGKAFVRTICMAFDLRHREKDTAGKPVFSQTI